MYTVDYGYLRPKKASATKKQHEAPYQCLDTPRVWRGKNATILPVRKPPQDNWVGFGGVLTESQILADFSFGESCVKPEVPSFYPQTPCEYRKETVVYCGYLIHHWGHFLVEGVTRLWYFLEQDPSVDKYIFALDQNEQRDISGNYKQFLTLLGIWDKVEFINAPATFQEVIVPDMAFRRWGFYSPKYLAVFDRIAQNVPPSAAPSPKRIFMSRCLLPKHKDMDFGFEAVDKFFERNGYTILYPERIPLSQLISYIRNAESVASVSGTLPQNMLFGKQGQQLIILERCAIIDDWQPPVNRIKELQVTYIDANIPIYTVPMSGPFIMGYNNLLSRYASDHNMCPPPEKYYSKRYFRSCFIGYMKSYSDLYRYQWFIQEYLLPEMDYHLEAYEAGAGFYWEYLSGRRPFRWYHYFQLHYWKQFVKRLLGRS